MQTLRQLLYAFALAGVTLASAELAARVEDRIRDGTPLTSSPSSERDLKISDELGPRGRPSGRYKKWRLNEWGFRGPSIPQDPRPGEIRVLILGSSESFGLYESPGLEFPAQLASRLRDRGDYEVVNAAVAGMTLATMTPVLGELGIQIPAEPRFRLCVAAVLPRRTDPRNPAGPFHHPARPSDSTYVSLPRSTDGSDYRAHDAPGLARSSQDCGGR